MWLARHDIARRTVRQRALTRFIAVCLLCGYGWLALSGALGLGGALLPGHPWHDAALHALTLGFVFSMVFGHAPVIVPALTRLPVKYHPLFYVPLGMLHTGLAMRVTGGLAEVFWLQRYGGIVSAAALAVFMLTLIAAVHAARRSRSATHRQRDIESVAFLMIVRGARRRKLASARTRWPRGNDHRGDQRRAVDSCEP